MKLVFFGSGRFGIPSLDRLKTSKHALLRVVTVPEKPKGRRREIQKSPVGQWAEINQVPCEAPASLKEPAVQTALGRSGADCFVVIDYGLLLPEAILKLPKLLSLNVHGSLLPRHRGASPVHAALLQGDRETGVTVIRMTAALDAGDILLQKKLPIRPEDDAVSLAASLAASGSDALLEALDSLEAGTARFRPQDPSQATYAKKIKKSDGHIRWDISPAEFLNRLRALKTWPTSFCFYQGKRILVHEAEGLPADPPRASTPGTLLEASPEKGVVVAVKKGRIRLLRLQQEGKTALPAAQFLNGLKLSVGGRFE